MNYFLNLVTSGMVIGTLYGLVAMGFAIVYRATGMVNFAQGEVMMLIAYISFSLAGIPGLGTGLGFAALLAAVLAVSVLLGLAIERMFIRPMLGEPMFSRVMVTIGLAVVIRSTVILVWGVEPTAFPRPFGSTVIRFAGLALYPGRSSRSSRWPCCAWRCGCSSRARASASPCGPRPTTRPRRC